MSKIQEYEEAAKKIAEIAKSLGDVCIDVNFDNDGGGYIEIEGCEFSVNEDMSIGGVTVSL